MDNFGISKRVERIGPPAEGVLRFTSDRHTNLLEMISFNILFNAFFAVSRHFF